jgi:hypothetical protein
LVARHVIGIAALAGIHPEVWKGPEPLLSWGGVLLAVVVASGVITGLAWIFFTKTQRGKTASNLRTAAWLICALIVIGGWGTYGYTMAAGGAALILLFVCIAYAIG